MNLVGFDPLAFYEAFRSGYLSSPKDFIAREPAAFLLRVGYAGLPDFLKRYPDLMASVAMPESIKGWEIAFTGYGLPKRWKPLAKDQASDLEANGSIRLMAYDPAELARYDCRGMIVFENGKPRLGKGLRRNLELLFNFD